MSLPWRVAGLVHHDQLQHSWQLSIPASDKVTPDACLDRSVDQQMMGGPLGPDVSSMPCGGWQLKGHDMTRSLWWGGLAVPAIDTEEASKSLSGTLKMLLLCLVQCSCTCCRRIELHKIPCRYMMEARFQGGTSNCMGVHGGAWSCMELQGFTWRFMDEHRGT